MRKADRETESRKLIGEKLREARIADNSPMTEEDAEYYRILAEARATHAAKENSRKSAKRHVLTSAAAILLILAVAGGSFILGMQSDVRASADPDDERKVVQQGDNIVIGTGVSEDDENVGVAVTIYDAHDNIPRELVGEFKFINNEQFLIKRIKITKSSTYTYVDTYYKLEDKINVRINEKKIEDSYGFSTALNQNIKKVYIAEQQVYVDKSGKSDSYTTILDNSVVSIFVPECTEINTIETIINSLRD